MGADIRCGVVAILGVPNAGKSTLLNALVGSKVAIVSPKVQTTRCRIRGITQVKKTQLIFVDTPGIFGATRKFEKAMVAAAWEGMRDADAVMLLIDCKRGICDQTKAIIEGLKDIKKPIVAVLNKVDIVDKAVLFDLARTLSDMIDFERIFMISALKADGVEDIKKSLADFAPKGPWLYAEDALTDMPSRQLAAEITREKLFYALGEELPYSVHVETESWEEKDDGSVKISQVIYVEREAHKKIVVGAKGAMLKSIGQASRAEAGRVLDRKVHLFLFVKVKEDWKDKPEAYREMGLEF